MKVGITLPQFRQEAHPAIDATRQAEAAGLDGVFVFDHLWPLGSPERPALHGLTLAAVLLQATDRLTVGTLVARVGILPNAVLAHTLVSLHRMGDGRFIAGLGIGDKKSKPENAAIGLPFRPHAERLDALVNVCRRLRAKGVKTWVGGTSASIWTVGQAEADAVNLWGVRPEELALRGPGAVTWAGQVDVGRQGLTRVIELLQEVKASGAKWAVMAPIETPWPEAIETIAAAAASLVD